MKYEHRLCTVCARGGSKGVKNKNSRLLLGRPMIAWTVDQALESQLFEHVVISTDSDEIAKAAQLAGAEVFFRRPPELATDEAGKLPVIQHAFLESEAHFGKLFDALVDLDATSPLRTSDDIRGAYRVFEDEGWENVITGMPSRRSPYFNLVEQSTDGSVRLAKTLDRAIVRRQDAPKCFDMNASIYIWTRQALLRNSSVLGPRTGIFEMPEERSIDVDSEIDFRLVELLMTEALNRG